MSENKIPYSEVVATAVMLGFDQYCLSDLSVNNPRVFGVIVDATVLRLTNNIESDE